MFRRGENIMNNSRSSNHEKIYVIRKERPEKKIVGKYSSRTRFEFKTIRPLYPRSIQEHLVLTTRYGVKYDQYDTPCTTNNGCSKFRVLRIQSTIHTQFMRTGLLLLLKLDQWCTEHQDSGNTSSSNRRHRKNAGVIPLFWHWPE